jgi:hypothetical protein
MDVLERNHHALLSRYVDACDSGHVLISSNGSFDARNRRRQPAPE